MHFVVKKTIEQKKQSWFKPLLNLLILVVAVPVIIIAGLSLALYFIFIWIKQLFLKSKQTNIPETHYHLEFDLISNENLRIILIEDESDTELTQLNETWQQEVNNEETYLYRAKTTPFIPALDELLCCFYVKEQAGGLLLQVLSKNQPANGMLPNTQLVFLDYENWEVVVVDEMGPFFLYNDENDPRVIRGFNKKEIIIIELA